MSERKRRTNGPDLLRVPPQNQDAECCLIGAIILGAGALDDVADIVTADKFYSNTLRKMYVACQYIYQHRGAIDAVTLANELMRRGDFDAISGPAHIAKVIESVPHSAHAKYYAGLIDDAWKRREIIDVAGELATDAYDSTTDVTEMVEAAEQRIFRISSSQLRESGTRVSETIPEVIETIRRRMIGEISTGLKTHFIDFDEHTTGLKPAELIILAARPSMGKTALVCNLANSIAKARKHVLFFSLEQSKSELTERLISINAEINSHDLRSGALPAWQYDQIEATGHNIKEYDLVIDDTPSRSIGQLTAISRRIHRKSPLDLIIIDYLQLIEPASRNSPREQQVADITRRLKGLAKELAVPVIALAQLNRGVENRDDKRPRLSDLRESGAIEQDADMVIFLHRPDAYEEGDRPGQAELIIAKHRSGPTGLIRLVWRKELMRFDDYSTVANLDYSGNL